MSLINLFTRQVADIGGIEFDAQFDFTYTSSSTLTAYQLEDGNEINNNVIINPTTISMQVGIGSRPLASWGGLAAASLSYIPGIAGNVISQATTLLSSGTQRGETLVALQNLLDSCTSFTLVLPGYDQMERMVVTGIDYAVGSDHGDGGMFTVNMQQLKVSTQYIDGKYVNTITNASEAAWDLQLSAGKAVFEEISDDILEALNTITGGA